GDLQRRRADAARRAVHEHRLTGLQAPARHEREVRGVVVDDQSCALDEVQRLGQLEREELARHRHLGEPAEQAARSDAVAGPDTSAVRGAADDRRDTSMPGTNGTGGLIWYMPRVWSSSGNDAPAACTSTITSLPGKSWCEASGSGSSTSFRPVSGPLSSTICTAFILNLPAPLAAPRFGGGHAIAHLPGASSDSTPRLSTSRRRQLE